MNSRRVGPPILELTAARLKEFVREPEALFWVFLFPILLALALGFAFRERPPEKLPVAVVETDTGETARVVKALSSSPALLVRTYPPETAREALRTGRAALLVEPGPPVLFRLDATRPDARAVRLEANDALQRAAGRADALAVKEERVTEKGARYIDYLVPGLIGMNLMGNGVWTLAFSITNARGRRVLKRLVATPMKKRDYLAAQILARLVFLVPETFLVLGFGWLAFDVAVRGSFAALFVVALAGAAAFSGIGLLIASRVTTIEGASGLANLVIVPMWILSGVFFSYERFPDAMRPFIRALPLTALNDALRAVVNEARPLVGAGGVAGELGVLALWAAVSFAVALKIFRWK